MLSLPESSTGAKIMLNLLTGQVTHQVSAASDSHTGPIRLVELVQNLKKSIHSIITPKLRSAVQLQEFTNLFGTDENYYMNNSYKSVTCATITTTNGSQKKKLH